MSVSERDPVAMGRGAVLCVPEVRWLRWAAGLLELGDDSGPREQLAVADEELTLLGRAFRPIAGQSADGPRLAVAARFEDGATVLIERRGARLAVAASPKPRPRGQGAEAAVLASKGGG